MRVLTIELIISISASTTVGSFIKVKHSVSSRNILVGKGNTNGSHDMSSSDVAKPANHSQFL